MAIPTNIDFDKILTAILQDYAEAARGWKGGRPHDEVAFLNRITEKLTRTRRKCDVGVTSPVNLYTKISFLHRQGPNQKDAFGADLAVTIIFGDLEYVKTAIFQLKKSDEYSVSLDLDDLKASKEAEELSKRSFLFAIDEQRLGSRIAPISDLAPQLGLNKSKTFDTNEWDFLSHWLWKWFSCDVGPESESKDGYPVESLLEGFAMTDPDADEDDDQNIPIWKGNPKAPKPELVPARAWIKACFKAAKDQK
jgi:hypothetical protein